MGNENMHSYTREDKKLRHTGAQASGDTPVRSSRAFRRDILRGLQSRLLPGFIHLQLTSWQCWSSVAVGRWPMGVCAPCAAVRPPGTPHSLPGHRKEGHLEKLPCTSFILTEVFLLYACIHLRVSSGKKEQDNLSRVMSPSRAKAAGQTQQLWGGGGGGLGGERFSLWFRCSWSPMLIPAWYFSPQQDEIPVPWDTPASPQLWGEATSLEH